MSTNRLSRVRPKSQPLPQDLPRSTLKCGSGAAWINNKVRHFRTYRQIRRGKNKYCYEIYTPYQGGKLKKFIVQPDDIKYLPTNGPKED